MDLEKAKKAREKAALLEKKREGKDLQKCNTPTFRPAGLPVRGSLFFIPSLSVPDSGCSSAGVAVAGEPELLSPSCQGFPILKGFPNLREETFHPLAALTTHNIEEKIERPRPAVVAGALEGCFFTEAILGAVSELCHSLHCIIQIISPCVQIRLQPLVELQTLGLLELLPLCCRGCVGAGLGRRRGVLALGCFPCP